MRNAPPDVLEPYFPTVGERNLIRHYCSNSTHLVMAVPASSSSLNPVLAITIPIVLSLPSNFSPAVEALRVSLLGVGAVHLAFLHARPSSDSLSQSVSSHPQRTTELMSLAMSYRQRATLYLNEALQNPLDGFQDAALGASVIIALIDIFSGGFGYIENLELAKAVVNVRGGPANMITHSTARKTSVVNGTSANLSPPRLMTEMLVVYDTFACFASGVEPVLLPPDDHSWWIVEPDEPTFHRWVVEKLFGLSREMLVLLAKVASLCARLSRVRRTETETLTPFAGFGDDGVLSPTASSNPNPDSNVAVQAGALEVYNELGSWISPSRRKGITPDAHHGVETNSVELEMSRHFQTLKCTQRVQTGNEAYRIAMQVLLLCDVLNVSPSDTHVQTKCKSVLTSCLDCAQNFGMSVGLIWPVIIAGSLVPPSLRQMVHDFYAKLRNHCCFDANTSEQIIEEVWRRTDQGLDRANWRSVIEDLNLKILVF
ncbi:hypothetical protein BOTBODRAFT_25855 [Botryobasidium botryosum FD-172 SS1]|uniref:Uncharacterized protein n=1 Tax=Botryobasidium botryosum (strain FD-172 SS1) TaxID=930990 RepID=A0A067NCC5_BOTB1|nr:hypothetical protein BOTBODRAFT_25855 [Botryobasidium botryosum FD-172 SS1]